MFNFFQAYQNIGLVSYAFSRFDYSRYLTRKDLNRKVLYRDWNMEGWTAKTVTDSDLKPPLISIKGKKVCGYLLVFLNKFNCCLVTSIKHYWSKSWFWRSLFNDGG